MRVPLVYLPCCPVPNCLGKQGELSGNSLPNLKNSSFCLPVYLLNKRSHGFFVLSNSWPVCQHILRELAEAGMCKFTQPKSCSCLLLSDNEQEHTSDITLPIRNVGPYSGRPTRFFTAFPIKGRKIGDSKAASKERCLSSLVAGRGTNCALVVVDVVLDTPFTLPLLLRCTWKKYPVFTRH